METKERIKYRRFSYLVGEAENKKFPYLYYVLCNKFKIKPKNIELYNNGLIRKIEKEYFLKEKLKEDPNWGKAFEVKNMDKLGDN